MKLSSIDPVPALLTRVRDELPAEFDRGPIRVSRAPGRLDVMGGIADYTGSMVCEATLDRAAAVALAPRQDRVIQMVSLNLRDEGMPHIFRISLDELAAHTVESLREFLRGKDVHWAGYLVGCLSVLKASGFIEWNDPTMTGLNIALYSTVPLGAGVSSSAAIEVAMMMNLRDQFLVGALVPNAMRLAALCQQVENHVVGAPCGIMDQVTSCAGQTGTLLRMICQPHELQPPLALPAGVRVIGINSRVRHSVGGGMYGRTRCAAFMAHRVILEKMRQMGAQAGQILQSDPMNGYLANLDADDYKRLFRQFLPVQMNGEEFIATFQSTIDTATKVDPAQSYHIQQAADHHILESRRVRNFAGFIESATAEPAASRQRQLLLDKAGHLMYASHVSYTNNALLGADECDLLVDLARQRESAGIYGAKITGGGSGGTVAVLCDRGEKADAAIGQIMAEYEKKTGSKPEAFLGTSAGAWEVGTEVV